MAHPIPIPDELSISDRLAEAERALAAVRAVRASYAGRQNAPARRRDLERAFARTQKASSRISPLVKAAAHGREVPFEVELATVSERLQYERRQLRRMLART